MQRELKQLYANLNKIRETIATYGAEFNAPMYWRNQHDQTQERIAELNEF